MNTTNKISIVIGSWGSYNECNERALGSKWLNLADYDSYDEIVEELKNEGFKLDGIDEMIQIGYDTVMANKDKVLKMLKINPKKIGKYFSKNEE